MATDPVERIRTFAHETPLAFDLATTLTRLAVLPPSTEAPYLTVALDWRPEGAAPGRKPPPEPKRSQRRAPRDDVGAPRRPSWEQVRRDLDELVHRYGPRGVAFDSLSADVQRLTTYLDEELDPAAQGVIVVVCQHQGVFEPVPLDVPVTTGIAVGPIPSLLQLVHAAEDFPPYAVLVADQREAIIWLMERQTWERGVQLEADDYPRKQQQGGWSQRRYQARADERVEAFAKTIAGEVRRALGEGNVAIPYLIVAAEEPMSSALAAEFHQTVSDRIIGHITLPNDASDVQVAAAAAPLLANVERQREMAAVQAVRDGVDAGSLGVAGPADTLAALETGQVRTLVMNDDFSVPGWADYLLPLYGVGAVPGEHPAGGDASDIVPTALEDEVIRLAVQTNAGVELVQTSVPVGPDELAHIPAADDPTPRAEAAKALDELGGIGAILRYSIEENQNGDGPM
jgi:hypothetical protein